MGMVRFAFRLLAYDKKKTAKLVALVAVTLFFPCVLIFSLRNYSEFQLQNAYHYSGEWDIKVNKTALSKERQRELGLTLCGEERRMYSAKAKDNSEDDMDPVYVEILECTAPEQLLYSPLIEGRYPEKDTELVLPYSCSYFGKSPKDGTLKLGETIAFEYGIRTSVDGEPTFYERIEEGETFTTIGTKEYTVVGFSVYIPISGIQSVRGISYLENGQEATAYYYMSNASTGGELKDLVSSITENSSEYNERVYVTMYQNKEAESAVARSNGIFIIAIGTFVTCFMLCGLMLHRRKHERVEQVRMLNGLGMTVGKRRMLYIFEWLGYVILGAVCAVLGFFLYTFVLQEVLPRFMVSGLSKMEGDFYPLTFIGLALALFLLGCAILWLEATDKQRITPKSKKEKIRTSSDLSVIYKRRKRIAKLSVIAMAAVTIMAISIGVPLMLKAYEANKTLKANSVNYDAEIRYKRDYRDGVCRGLLEGEESVASFIERIYAGADMVLDEHIVTETVWSFLQNSELYADVIAGGEYPLSLGVRGCSKAEYEALRELNPHLMPYEEWCNSKTALIDDFFNLSDDWRGENAGDNRYAELVHTLKVDEGDTITVMIDGAEGQLEETMTLGQSITTPVLYQYPQVISIQVYVPEAELAARKEVSVVATYSVQVKKGFEEQFNQKLAEWMTVYSALLGDYDYIGVLEVNDSIRIQFIVIAALVAALSILCVIGMYVMIRIDMEYQTKQFLIFRRLGMTKLQAMNMRISERMGLLSTAMLVALAGNLIVYYTVLAGYVKEYHISTANVFLYFVVACVSTVVLGVGDSILLTKQQYNSEIVEVRGQE